MPSAKKIYSRNRGVKRNETKYPMEPESKSILPGLKENKAAFDLLLSNLRTI